jgi:hypothetical protein
MKVVSSDLATQENELAWLEDEVEALQQSNYDLEHKLCEKQAAVEQQVQKMNYYKRQASMLNRQAEELGSFFGVLLNTEEMFQYNILQLEEVENFVYQSLDVVKNLRVTRTVSSGEWAVEPEAPSWLSFSRESSISMREKENSMSRFTCATQDKDKENTTMEQSLALLEDSLCMDS